MNSMHDARPPLRVPTRAARRLALAVLPLALGCASMSIQDELAMAVPGDVTVDVQESTYAVFGRTIPDIWDSLNERGPALRNRIVAGVHSWNLTWDMEWVRSDEGCRVEGLEIVMSTEIMMPDWRQRAGADQELQDHWDEFVRQLREHEEAHRGYALDTVRDLHRTILAERAPDCPTVRDRITAQTDVIMDRYEALNSALDDRSMLTWPPRR
jgi:predicted secreted Zn-dependent protease